MTLQPSARERAGRYDGHATLCRVVDRCGHEQPAEAAAFELVRHFRVHDLHVLLVALVLEHGYVAVDRDLESGLGRVVDDGRVRGHAPSSQVPAAESS